MPRFNSNFELNVEDMDLIEEALRLKKLALTQERLEANKPQNETVSRIHNLLGRLHNQKEFYRPRKGTYISG